MQLQKFFKLNPRIAVAFSGGVDSSYLLYAARTAGCDVRAYFIKSQFQPRVELNEAIRVAGRLGVALTVDALNIVGITEVANNPPDRCYHCKTQMLSRLRELAKADGFHILCDGTNADDDISDRPGIRALEEQGVYSPLRDSGLTKAEIRHLSKQAGLSTFDKPSYSCLATRIPEGTTITVRLLEKIERAEEKLYEMGYTDLRVRFIPPAGAKIQLLEEQIGNISANHADIRNTFSQDFDTILLDLTPR